jgi:hypothetical protein
MDQISREFYEVWPQIEEYFKKRVEEEPYLMRHLIEAKAERLERSIEAPPVITHETLLERLRGLAELARMNLAFARKLHAEMEAEQAESQG